jgi:hypothetical protein
MIRKMALIDVKTLENLQQRQQPPPQDHVAVTPGEEARTRLSSLDSQLKEVLERNDLSNDEKMNLYTTILDRFIGIRKKVFDAPMKVHVESTPETRKELERTEKFPKEVEKVSIDTVPITYKNRARALINRIKDIDNISIGDNGELSIDGDVVHGSNIADLVNDVIRRRKDFNPSGWRDFATLLAQSNVPETLIGNSDRLHFMKSQKRPSSVDPSNLSMHTREEQSGKGLKRRKKHSHTPTKWLKL